jgi:hypothetical protein
MRTIDFFLTAGPEVNQNAPEAVTKEAGPDIIIGLPSGNFLCVPNSEDSPDGIYTIRILRPDGSEQVMWDSQEWGDDPVLVMGAIFGAILGGDSK